MLHVTRAGKTFSRSWLVEPVEHLRDVRTVLLVKFQLLERMGQSPVPLAMRQQEAFAPLIAAITAEPPIDVVGQWRVEHAQAVDRFLEGVIEASR